MLKCIECSEWVKENILSFAGDKWWCPKCSAENVRCKKDMVSSPSHYADHYPFEVCDAIKLLMDNFCEGMEAYECYCLGNELKYRLRAGFKEPDKIEQDIKKSLWYNKARREG